MLSDQPFLKVLIINIFLGTVWHIAMLYWCVFRKTTAFDSNKKIYRPRKWEKDGKFYSDVLKINRWKDFLPQYVGKGGFSKEHLDNNVSIEYLDRFILETCRGEWNHSMNCTFTFVLLVLNSLPMGIILSILLILGNLPFIVIQRYNRLRLQKLRKILLKRTMRQQQSAPVDN